MFWFFGCEACGILAPRPGIEPVPPALEGEVLTTVLPRKSLLSLFILVITISRAYIGFEHVFYLEIGLFWFGRWCFYFFVLVYPALKNPGKCY